MNRPHRRTALFLRGLVVAILLMSVILVGSCVLPAGSSDPEQGAADLANQVSQALDASLLQNATPTIESQPSAVASSVTPEAVEEVVVDPAQESQSRVAAVAVIIEDAAAEQAVAPDTEIISVTLESAVATEPMVEPTPAPAEEGGVEPTPEPVEASAETPITDAIAASVDAVATVQPVEEAVETPTATPAPTVQAVTQPEVMNARRGPGTDYDVTVKLNQGTEVTVLASTTLTDSGDVWLLVTVSESSEPVWIFAGLVEVLGTPDTLPEANSEVLPPTPAPTPTSPALFVEKVVNVREGPGTAYPVIAATETNRSYAIVGRNEAGDWWQIETDSEQVGWVYAPLTVAGGDLGAVALITDIPAPPEAAPVAVAAALSASAPAPPAPAPTGGGGFGYGVQAHIVHTGQEGQVMGHVRNLGFGWVKQQVEWRLFEPNQGQINLGALHPIINAANGSGVNVLFSVVNAPDWARESGFDGGVGGPPQDPQTFANFLGQLAAEFCGSSLKAIEVWNEQNLHYEWGNKPLNPADYLNLLRPAYASIKNRCPSMKVISGALTPAGDNGPFAMDDLRYLEGMFQNGLVGYADGIGSHPSGYNVPPSVRHESACEVIQTTGNFFNGACDSPHHSWSFRSTMEGYRNLAVRYGAGHLLIWPTEFGWAAGGAFDGRYAYANDNSFEEQAQWTVEAYNMMRNWGWVGPAFLWNLNFRVVADGTEKAQWGIVRNDWSPLPVYDALRNMPK